MTHHCGANGDCFLAGCDIPDNVKCGKTNGWRQMAYANADEVLRLTTANDLLRDTVDFLNRYIEQLLDTIARLELSVERLDRDGESLLQTIEHLESEVHLLSDHICALESENSELRRRFALDDEANGYRAGG